MTITWDEPSWFDDVEGSSRKGISVCAVDLGMVTGLAWCVVARKELASLGAHGAIKAASLHESGVQLADSRAMFFEIGQRMEGVPDWRQAEIDQVFEVYAHLEVMSRMTARTSGGRIPELDVVVIEDFTVRERTKDRSLLSPVRLANQLLMMLALSNDLEVFVKWQQPSEMSVATDDRLKAWDLWLPGKKDARAATKHLIRYLRDFED